MTNTRSKHNIGLILQGGGARGAYQVGVIKALAEINEQTISPFPIICGTSAGAINACALVANADNFKRAARRLEILWRGLKTEKIFNPKLSAMLATIARIIISSLFRLRSQKHGWFDNQPLRQMLDKQFNRDNIDKMKEKGWLDGFCVTASCYKRGVAISYFESNTRKTPWQRSRREGDPTTLTVDHIMASTALPWLFPAVHVENSFHGDGALRLTQPLSPAIKLGADKLIAIETRDAEIRKKEDKQREYPSSSHLLGYAFDILFNDNLDADIERLTRINTLLEMASPTNRKDTKYKKIDILVLQPSKDICEIASQHNHEIPRGLKVTLQFMSGGNNDGRVSSYMMFEPQYIRELIELGYNDTIKRKSEIQMFLKGE